MNLWHLSCFNFTNAGITGGNQFAPKEQSLPTWQARLVKMTSPSYSTVAVPKTLRSPYWDLVMAIGANICKALRMAPGTGWMSCKCLVSKHDKPQHFRTTYNPPQHTRTHPVLVQHILHQITGGFSVRGSSTANPRQLGQSGSQPKSWLQPFLALLPGEGHATSHL